MKRFAFTALGAGCLAAALALPPSALAAPSGTGSARDTLNTLRQNGYHVVVNKVGEGALDHCTVSRVRKGSPITVPADPPVAFTTVFVDVVC